jgi:radical SAM protein with 4Fe4S-binding SPASM domain
MSESFVSPLALNRFTIWKKAKEERTLISFNLEITARCNNDCRHCYINLPAGDKSAKAKELTFEEIKVIADDALRLNALFCLITGGEPLLREDFADIYIYLKKKGFLVSVFTNANIIKEEHIKLFKEYPPRDIEVSVYGVTEETYERVTRKRGSFATFMRGLNLLSAAGIKMRLKAMALRSNFHEMPEIANFCRQWTKDYFRFSPFLHLRFDGDPVRNEEIKSERLSPEQIIELEQADTERFQAMEKKCSDLIVPEYASIKSNRIFYCGAGNNSFDVSYDGFYRLCSSLWHPDCVYDLRKGSVIDAWTNFVPQVRNIRSNKEEFLDNCRGCILKNLCMWCPAHAYLENGHLDLPVDYFCRIAHARAEMLTKT